MITQKDLSLKGGNAANGNGGVANTQTHTEESHSLVETVTKTAPSLRQRLLTTILPITLVPLAIIGAIGYIQTEKQFEARQLQQLEEVSLLSSSTTSIFLNTHLAFHSLIANNDLLKNALAVGLKQVNDQGLSQQPIDVVEQKFASTKLLQPNTALNTYLQQAATNAGLAEIIVTEPNGFNVGFNQMTTDFVQNDEVWWQKAKELNTYIGVPAFDQSTNQTVIELTNQIQNNTGEMIGMIKIGIPLGELSEALRTVVEPNLTETEVVQLLTTNNTDNPVTETFTSPESTRAIQGLIGGEKILTVAKLLTDHEHTIGQDLAHDHGGEHSDEHAGEEHAGGEHSSGDRKDAADLTKIQTELENIPEFKDVRLVERTTENAFLLIAEFTYQGRFYNLSLVPDTQMVMATSVDTSESVAAASGELLRVVVSLLILAGLLGGVLFWLSHTLSRPLAKLTDVADEAREGNLDLQAEVEGTRETQVLAQNFNRLVSEVKTLLNKTEQATQEQKDSRDKLEMEIYQLLDEVGEAVDGDLTVRASLTSIEMSTVADLFNAIIDNLNDIAIQVKDSSVQVSSSLDENGTEIQALAEQAVQETERTRTTLDSIEKMSTSIEDVASNAGKAALISDQAYTTVQEGSNAMDQTVDSILDLRNTVGETAKKIKRLGESSQKISQVVSLIEEIALKTNLLAINASVEASRAGEQGQGFTIVAEQVGALAEQSTAATKEIAQIVAGIQAETKEVTEAMEVGTNQVVDSTRLVETSKAKLAIVLSRSQEINDLMRSISDATVSQTETSQVVTTLMQQMAELSEQRAESSTQVAESMQEMAAIAEKLEAAVAQFKVEESS